MALFTLPVDANDPFYTLDMVLSGVSYRLAFAWNGRGGFWTFDIRDTADNVLQASIKLVASWELIQQFTNPALPPGSIYCVDTSGQDLDPAYGDLGARILVVYDDGLS